MINKYRVHEVAKDFNMKSNAVIDLLAKYFGDTKKHMTALEEIELDVIFETFTQQNQVESFDEYFAAGETERKKKQAEKEKAKADWVDSFSVAGSMLIAMTAAIFLGRLI